MNANYTDINAEAQEHDPNSVLAFYREMNRIRKENPIVTYGDYRLLDPADSQVWAYERHFEDRKLTVIANFTDQTVTRTLAKGDGALLQHNYTDDTGEGLRPYEVKVYLE